MDRRPPVPPEDRYGNSRGQAYRPDRSPPPHPRGGYRPRSPPRGGGYGPPDGFGPGRGPPPRGRSRSPPPFRRRSRSPPPYRGREGERFHPRPRSPMRRPFDDGRDIGYRDGPSRDMRDDGRYRERSPLLEGRSPIPAKRSRDASPYSNRGRYSPPAAKRERLVSPARSRFSDHSGPRDRSMPGRPYSPPRHRRQSPPRGPPPRDYRPGSRSPPYRTERVDPRAVDNWRRRSPSPRRSEGRSGTDSGPMSRKPSPPVHPSRLATQDGRPGDDLPPTRASGGRSPARGPIADAARAPVAQSQPGAPAPLSRTSTEVKSAGPVSPTAPRAAGQTVASSAPGGPRANRGPSFAGPGHRPYDAPSGPPSGPRSGAPPSAPSYNRSQSQRFPPASAPGPRVHPALASLPPLLEEGKKFPDLFDRGNLERLERQTEETRRAAQERQARKRKGLREWERLEMEVQLAELRQGLAEESLSRLGGGEGVAMF